MDYDKYIEALKHETPDTVMGSLMSQVGFPEIVGIGDACDIAQSTDNQDDLDLINEYQPMFYNYKFHRLVNKQDVLDVIQQLQNK